MRATLQHIFALPFLNYDIYNVVTCTGRGEEGKNHTCTFYTQGGLAYLTLDLGLETSI